MKHYIYKAEEGLRNVIRNWASKGHVRASRDLAEILKGAIRCPVYALPDDGNLVAPAEPTSLAADLYAEAPRLLRLPHRELVIEYDAVGPENICVRKRAVYCREATPAEADRGQLVRCLEFFFDEEKRFWLLDPFWVWFGSFPEAVKCANGARPLGACEILDIPGAQAVAEEASANAMLGGYSTMLSLIVALSCQNVVAVPTSPDARVNRIRVARGRPPFATYYTLDLVEPKSREEHEPIGSHASPALHVRSGHIRRLPPDRRIWVNACMVGSPENGVVTKGYRAAAVAAARRLKR